MAACRPRLGPVQVVSVTQGLASEMLLWALGPAALGRGFIKESGKGGFPITFDSFLGWTPLHGQLIPTHRNCWGVGCGVPVPLAQAHPLLTVVGAVHTP